MADSLISDPDREARLEELMRLYGDTLVRMCCLYLHDAALVQDAAHGWFSGQVQRTHMADAYRRQHLPGLSQNELAAPCQSMPPGSAGRVVLR